VASGAAFGAALGLVLPQFPLSVQVAAFLGALAAVGLVHLIARSRGDAPIVTLVLSGVIVGAMFAAGVSMLKYLAADSALREIVFWLMGGFYFANWSDVRIVGPVVLVTVALMTAGGWRLNVLAMGDQEAETLGIDPRRSRRVLVAAATLATAVSVSAVGVVPWIGLMTPHAVRLLVGPDNRAVVAGSAVLGALFLLVCDTAARSMTSSEIPVGIITALAGGPFLAYLVRQRTAGLFG
ncbi:MAG: iron ABC transporter permease, partial [Vicinamibacterales bacterium]|nr:iron ABC transporter permease [Vicinamibacterales bacterium]